MLFLLNNCCHQWQHQQRSFAINVVRAFTTTTTTTTTSTIKTIAHNAAAKRLRWTIPAASSSLFSTTVDDSIKAEEIAAAPPLPPQKIPEMEEIVSLCKRRGIIFPSSEIYNGYAGFFDYGPLGSELKKNLKDAWWKHFVTQREDVVGLDSSIVHNPTTWKSSGTFTFRVIISC